MSENHPHHNKRFTNNSKSVEKELGIYWHRNNGNGIAEDWHLVFFKDPQKSFRDLRRPVVIIELIEKQLLPSTAVDLMITHKENIEKL